ncbi:sensor histidine kinase [Thiospirillum jenense]|uniref:histidine kinase n=1 Tax=Thiospirillum jenense TaxID=1653858 RepID=A0A839HAR6_9GAMM|nr:HAMP domain-containing sensor histidine kinase [Thiospirillum jenense]MBB1126153.1 HAMP domain-containing histidine kinase [Thiospirillum jenense]
MSRSLRLRLWLAALISSTIALTSAGVGLITLFERHVERRIGSELHLQLNQLAAAVTIADDGSINLRQPLNDPRFNQPLSGLYWQIDADQQLGLLRSRSLWDYVLQLPVDTIAPDGVHAHQLPGPNHQQLLVRERQLQLQIKHQFLVLRLIIGLDRHELMTARAAFAADMQPYLMLLLMALLAATWLQIYIGLQPLNALKRGVEMVNAGHARELTSNYPSEVMPLVNALNHLLTDRAQAVERARAWTADLAHGLKTPLAALAADAQQLRAQGQLQLADNLEQLAEAMRRRVERELIRARVRAGTAPHEAHVALHVAITRLLRVLQRTPAGERLTWQVEIPPDLAVALMPDDLFDLLGNVLENAAKWARSNVWIAANVTGNWVQIDISDDGTGVAEMQLSRLGERGLRLDQHKDGSGLGLAIVRDIVDAYGGAVRFECAANSGLIVRVQLPLAG